MTIYTSKYLRNLSQTKTFSTKQQIINESKKVHTGFDIFLSHSFLDKEDVEGLYIELTNFGYSVYVDWIIDPELDRKNVTKATATLIRNRMKFSKSLLLAVSENAQMSKWMPWELGYVDANTNKCAVIPVSQSVNAPSFFKGFEYLSLYPFIKKVPTKGLGEKLFVIEEAKKYVFFDNWLKFGENPKIQIINIY
ncbi:hypothetical protein SDC9_40316 [bioreactor metagenome]|uniref:TIR domain-containing protein n=1 Tax=bioreactor metagenome TaxID=1076179 RepID=A0A644VS18_9ZZZZ